MLSAPPLGGLLRIIGRVPGLDVRSTLPEYMDDPAFTGPDLVESFAFIRMVNLLGGGWHAVFQGLRQALRGWPRSKPVEILDIGCGIGDLGVAMSSWANRHGFVFRYRGLDRSNETLALARQRAAGHGFEFMNRDLFRDPLPEADLVVASMVLHHFDDQGVVQILRKMARSARKAVIINDLERAIEPWAVAWLLTLPLRPASRADALVSVEKGFTRLELEALGRRAGLEIRIRPAIGWRLLGVASAMAKGG